MNHDAIAEAVRMASRENRLTCGQARDISEKLDVPLREIGAICNELKIRITSCELGCF